MRNGIATALAQARQAKKRAIAAREQLAVYPEAFGALAADLPGLLATTSDNLITALEALNEIDNAPTLPRHLPATSTTVRHSTIDSIVSRVAGRLRRLDFHPK